MRVLLTVLFMILFLALPASARVSQIVLEVSPGASEQLRAAGAISLELSGEQRKIALKPVFRVPGDPEQRKHFQQLEMGRWFTVQGVSPNDAPTLDALERHSSVRSLILEQPATAAVLPTDYSNHNQYQFLLMDCPTAWNLTSGDESIIIATLDTGCELAHEDLVDNMFINDGEDVNGNGIWDAADNNGVDDDGNGYVDDVQGWDFVFVTVPDYPSAGEDYSIEDNDVTPDIHGHGTHVQGIATGRTNNSIGISSASWNVTGLPIRAGYSLEDAGGNPDAEGYDSDFAAALQYAVDMGAHIISISFSNTVYAGYYQDAVDYARASNALVIASAGNESSSAERYPAAYDGVIAVAATDQDDELASFSNYGDWVDICAPGVDIWSTVSNNAYHAVDYIDWDGTSAAAPMVAAVAGLLWSYDPTLLDQEVATYLLVGAEDIDDLNPGYEGDLGAGRLNAHHSIMAVDDSDLDPPLNLSAVVDDGTGEVTLNWSVPTEDGGPPTQQISYDDGSNLGSTGYFIQDPPGVDNTGGVLGVRMNAATSCQILDVSAYTFSGAGSPLNMIRFMIWDGDGSEDAPASQEFLSELYVPEDEEWLIADLANENINVSEQFWVCVYYEVPGGPAIGWDASAPQYFRSYNSLPEYDTWDNLPRPDDTLGDGDLMIRATVLLDDGTVAEIGHGAPMNELDELQDYYIFRNGRHIATTSATNYVDPLPVGGEYVYTVRAHYTDGVSGPSNVETAIWNQGGISQIFIWDPVVGDPSAIRMDYQLDIWGYATTKSSVMPADLSPYDLVMCFMGTYPAWYAIEVGDPEVGYLTSYLDGGGYLYGEGPVAFSASFPQDIWTYFHVTNTVYSNSSIEHVEGVSGTWMEGITLPYSPDPYSNTHNVVEPYYGAVMLLDNPDTAFENSGVCVLHEHFTENYKTAAMACRYTSIGTDGSNDRRTVLSGLLDWFNTSEGVTKYSISGDVTFHTDGWPIAGANLHLEMVGVDTRVLAADAAGQFVFNDLYGVDYYLVASKDETGHASVNTFDAYRIQQHIVDILPFTTGYEMHAADTDQFMESMFAITTSDAAKVQELVVGLIDGFETGDWTFVSSDYDMTVDNWTGADQFRNYLPLDADQFDQGFIGMRVGDTNGSWSPGFAGPRELDEGHLLLTNASAEPGEEVTLELRAEDLCDLKVVEAHIEYDPEVLTLQEFTPVGLDQPVYNITDSTLAISWYDVLEPIDGSDNLLGTLTFQAAETAAVTAVSFDRVQLMDADSQPVICDLIDGEVTIMVSGIRALDAIVTDWALHPVFPNPFNPTATLTFDVKQAGHVQLAVYNLLGAQVATLADMELPNGRYSVTLDGSAWASGSYFVLMQAPGFHEVQKIVLMK